MKEDARLGGRPRLRRQSFAVCLTLLHHKVAERLGLTGTDSEHFRLIQQRGPLSIMTPALEIGLQVEPSSRLVDRLEAACFVRRERDIADKRRLVLIAWVQSYPRNTAPNCYT